MTTKKQFSQSFRKANYFSRFIIFFIRGLINKLNSNEVIQDIDLLDMNNNDDETSKQSDFFLLMIQQRIATKRRCIKSPLAIPLFQTIKSEFFFCLIAGFLSETFALFCTIFVGEIVNFIQDDSDFVSTGLLKALIYTIALFLWVICKNQFNFNSQQLALRTRKILTTAIYAKASRVNYTQMQGTNSSQLIVTVSSEILAAERIISLVFYLILAPLSNIIVIIFIGAKVGKEYALVSFLLFCIMLLFLFIVNHLQFKFKTREAQINDKRTKFANETINGIRILRCYGWEMYYSLHLKQLRKQQEKWIFSYTLFVSLGNIIASSSGIFNSAVIFLMMWRNGIFLQQGTIFSILSVFSYISTLTNTYFFQGSQGLTQFRIVLNRLEKVLMLPEHQFLERSSLSKVHISLSDASFNYDVKGVVSTQPILNKLTFVAQQNQLLAVIGQVGSGKSTLLLSLLQETNLISGGLDISGKVAYTSQDPFLISASVKDNITFGEPYNEELFNQIIKLSQLQTDIESFANKEQTMIGEKGINISGGQRSRIGLARALYSQADIYLLDDPLSALDPKIAQKILKECIQGYLSDKCVILVTHQIQYIRRIPNILLLQSGKLSFQGTYDDLITEYPKLAQKALFSRKNQNSIQLIDSSDYTEATSYFQSEESQLDNIQQTVKNLKNQEEATPNLIEKEKFVANRKICLTYFKIAKYSLGIFTYILMILTFTAPALMSLFVSYWLSEWTKNSLQEQRKYFYVKWYIIGVMFTILLNVIRNFTFQICIFIGNKNLYKSMVKRILQAELYFFDSNPPSRIITRFSKDLAILDNQIFYPLLFMIGGFVKSACALISIAIQVPYSIIFSVAAVLLTIYFFKKLEKGLQICQDVDAIARGPIHATLQMLCDGLVNIRCFQKFDHFKQEFIYQTEKSANATFTYLALSRWLSVRIDIIFMALTILAVWVLTAFKGYINSTQAAFILQTIIDAASSLGQAVRFYSEFQYKMSAGDRILQYTGLDIEGQQNNEKDPPNNWPQNGNIVFQDVILRYRKDLKPSLDNINFEIKSGMKVGIVGQSGAGKSSIIAAFFRLYQSEGLIKIDNVDIKTVPLQSLRNSISYIPQMPLFFPGTIRQNLDIKQEKTDEEIMDILEKVKLSNHIKVDMLNKDILSSEIHFSAGQRQLFCLARALLQNNRIIIFDEATANIDYETEEIIENILKKTFENQTILIIAHRLQSIIEADRVLVMQNGKVKEFDQPYKLCVNNIEDTTITNEESLFGQMIQASGKKMAKILFQKAKFAFQERQKQEILL